jgi:hypothetical protein
MSSPRIARVSGRIRVQGLLPSPRKLDLQIVACGAASDGPDAVSRAWQQ